MIDLHSHLLPGIDDGPPDLGRAVALARAAVAEGTTAMAATPHIDHKHGVDIGSLAERRAAVEAALGDEGIGLEVLQGGEITITKAIELSSEELGALTLGSGRHLLLECPFTEAGPLLDHAVSDVQARGFAVLLGHPERSPHFRGRPDALADLVARGCHVQVTSASMAGRFGRTVQQFTLELFQRGLVHVVASDAHDTERRAPGADRHFDAIARILPDVAAARGWWTDIAPGAIAAGRAFGTPPPVRGRRRLLRLRG